MYHYKQFLFKKRRKCLPPLKGILLRLAIKAEAFLCLTGSCYSSVWFVRDGFKV